MNKKLLFGIMSLAALTACTDDVLESKNVAGASEDVSPVQFEVINANDAMTRASMDGNSIVWNANDGDLFTLYHGGTLTSNKLSGFQNATYQANANDGGTATLSTPSMIKAGRAIMVWPVDTVFYADGSGNLKIKVDEVQKADIENYIPYASDLITIKSREDAATPPTYAVGAYNTAGYERKYPVYMRPMASQLILKADYAGTDGVLSALTTGDDPIDPIALTSVDIVDPATTPKALTKEIELSFATPTSPVGDNWATVDNQAWTEVTAFDRSSATAVAKLSTKCISGIESAKFLILPTKTDVGTGGLAGASVVVNTIYGKVEIGGATTSYSAADLADAWYRYMAPGATVTYGENETTTAGTGSDASKVRYTQDVEKGLAQVLDAFSSNTTKKTTSIVAGEPTGAVGTRYVKVLLTKLDMDGLHVKTDKQLYDAVRVWKEIGTGDVTVNLDGDATDGEFEISQKTIAKINEINAELAEATTPRKFTATACSDAGEICNTIVITGGGAVQNMDFILNTVAAADVALAEGDTWQWAASETAAKTLTVAPVATCGISRIINKGTFVSDATATLAIYDNAATPAQVTTIPFVNDGTWNVTAGDVNVQFDVTNNGEVNISSGAEYHQDGTGNDFVNEATTLAERFVMNDPSIDDDDKAAFEEQIGVVNNSGVFATVNGGHINNYGLIEHANENAKTYITANQSLIADGFTANATYTSAFNPATSGAGNKMGRINLPYSNRNEDNVSISAGTTASGFVSLTVSTGDGAPTDGKLNLNTVGYYVNYCIIKSGVTEISQVNSQVKYLEFNDDNKTEIAWNLGGTPSSVKSATYEGLIVLSPVNIKLWTNITVNSGTYLGAKMYVGGGFTNTTGYNAYYGKTAANAPTMYITY